MDDDRQPQKFPPHWKIYPAVYIPTAFSLLNPWSYQLVAANLIIAGRLPPEDGPEPTRMKDEAVEFAMQDAAIIRLPNHQATLENYVSNASKHVHVTAFSGYVASIYSVVPFVFILFPWNRPAGFITNLDWPSSNLVSVRYTLQIRWIGQAGLYSTACLLDRTDRLANRPGHRYI